MVNDLQDGTALSCIIVEGSLAEYGFIMLLISRLVAALALAGTAIASQHVQAHGGGKHIPIPDEYQHINRG